jgi:RNA-directed DNA polymerase
MQALHALALAPIAETLADRYSYGFREGRRCADALEQVFTILSQKRSAPWVLEGDIRACFDEISHEWLLAHVPMDKQLLRGWLKAGYWEKGALYPTTQGTPQGGLISPLLANLALDGMERAVKAVAKTGDKVNFVRYADDFVVTGANRELLEQKVKPALAVFLQERGLALSEQKTVITHIQTGFDFLGHTVRKYGDKLLITPAKSKVKGLRERIGQVIQSAQGQSQARLLRQLNPLLRGWANYYRNGAAQRTFDSLDYYVFGRLWRWISRRHPNKTRAWKQARYYSASGRAGVFSVRVNLARGGSRVLQLYRMGSTGIERHLRVRGQANPYDARYQTYFAQRRSFVWRVRWGGSKTTAPGTKEEVDSLMKVAAAHH